MTRELHAVNGAALYPALRDALARGGPAVFAGDDPGDLPDSVSAPVALVVQSSGSTAHPKRVALSADALLASAAASEGALGGPGQWLLALPVTYIAGINVLVRSICAGTDPAWVDAQHFDPMAFVAAAGTMDHPLRFTSLVPAQLARLIDTPAALAVLRRFDRILLGGQATPPALLARAEEIGLSATRTYGSSETSGGCVYDGSPIGTAEVRIADGEIELAGPMLAESYLADPARTDATFYTEGSRRWYRTGDTGTLTDGVLSVTGRLDDVIISGGVKVSLGELELFVGRATPLHDGVVVPAADERWGEVPVVVSTVSMPLDELRAVVAKELGVAAAPSAIVVVDSIPLLASGKPDRLALRAVVAR